MISSKTKIRVRYEETDKMGIVYHAKYFVWFEVARIELLDQIRCSYKQLEYEGYHLPVLEAQANFFRPANFDDLVTVSVEFSTSSRLKMEMNYKVNRRGELLATGRTIHAFVSREGKPIRPPENLARSIEKFSRR